MRGARVGPIAGRVGGEDVGTRERMQDVVEPVAAPHDVGALLRSLGDPPSIGGSNKAAHYFDAVLERSAAIAIALATSADLLADPLD